MDKSGTVTVENVQVNEGYPWATVHPVTGGMFQ